ncbi:hypothetical protein IWT30_02058 [Secundilactobacillus mixtipabuli]|uniref:Uncharacterized protein n=1 Tax=Secundilactobacillus mixtipabuli TaxID=1435342 RepID=A0A1Z5IEJ2_9LACO|nr:hypothetical protein IWT30_02058 [Secundilactobacillus mixtipabuli]
MTYYIDLEPTCRQRVERQGYLVPDELQLEEVIPASEDAKFLPRWDHVLALINRADTQSHYNTIILYDDQRLIKVRPTTNKLVKKLRQHFALDYHNDICKTIAKALNIKKNVPYICRDFWLMQVGPVVAHNRTWFRWQYQSDMWDYVDNYTRVIVRHRMVLQWAISRKVMEKRQHRCKQIASYLKQQTALVCPTFKLADLGHTHSLEVLDKLMVKIEKYKRALILGKVGFLEFTDEVDDDLNHNRYWQLPDTEF